MSLTLPSYVKRTGDAWRSGARWLAGRMPKGLLCAIPAEL